MDQNKIGKFIADERKLKKITQLELAEMLGVSYFLYFDSLLRVV